MASIWLYRRQQLSLPETLRQDHRPLPPTQALQAPQNEEAKAEARNTGPSQPLPSSWLRKPSTCSVSSTLSKSRNSWRHTDFSSRKTSSRTSTTKASSPSPWWATVSISWQDIPNLFSYIARWERKGKLKKKNLNNDVFKERHFELVRDNLYYYKSERTKDQIFTCIILSNADIRMYSSEANNSHLVANLPSYIKDRNSSYYFLEIENESRPFVL